MTTQDKLAMLPKFNDKVEKEFFLKVNYSNFYQCYETALVTASLLDLNMYCESEFIFPKISYLEDKIVCFTSETCCFILEEEKIVVSSINNKDYRNFVEVDNKKALAVIPNIIIEDFSFALSEKEQKTYTFERYLFRDQYNRIVAVVDGLVYVSIEGSNWIEAKDEKFYWSSKRRDGIGVGVRLNSFNELPPIHHQSYSFHSYLSPSTEKKDTKRKNWLSWLDRKKNK